MGVDMNDLLKAAYKGIKRDYFGRMATSDGEAGSGELLQVGGCQNRLEIEYGKRSASPPLFLRDPKEIAE